MNAVAIACPVTVDGPVTITATASTVVAAAAKLRLFVTQGDVSLEEVGDTIILPVPGIRPVPEPEKAEAGVVIDGASYASERT
ncbi:major facilitator superfamily transporter [Apiospora arundinis]